MSKADVSDALRNVRVNPDKAYNFCRTVGDLGVIATDVRVVGITWVLGRHVGRSRTRALQHHARFDPAVGRREINDGSRKGSRSLGRRTHSDSAGRKKIRAHRGERCPTSPLRQCT